jgi:adenosine/AMP kinase
MRPETRKFLERLAPAAPPEVLAAVKQQARQFFGVGDDVTISVIEVDCSDAACPGIETTIAVLEARKRPRIVRFQKRVADVSKDDFDRLMKVGPGT